MSTTKVTDAMIDGVAASKLTGALPAISGASLTALPATLPASSGVNLTALNATNLGSGTASVARGGTGAATHTANNVLVGNGTSAIASVAPSTSGNVLTSNGSAWTSAAAAAGGKLLQVVQGSKTDTASTTSTSFADSGLTATITPSATSSKILVLLDCYLGVGGSTYKSQVLLVRDSTDISIGDAAGSRGRATGEFTYQSYTGSLGSVVSNYLDSPSTTSAVVYKMQYRVETPQTVYLNRSAQDTDVAHHARVSSHITLMEIGA